MLAVPRQQVVDLVSRRDADVKGIDGGLLRQRALSNQLTCEVCGGFGEGNNRNPAKCPQPTGALDRITDPRLDRKSVA